MYWSTITCLGILKALRECCSDIPSESKCWQASSQQAGTFGIHCGMHTKARPTTERCRAIPAQWTPPRNDLYSGGDFLQLHCSVGLPDPSSYLSSVFFYRHHTYNHSEGFGHLTFFLSSLSSIGIYTYDSLAHEFCLGICFSEDGKELSQE